MVEHVARASVTDAKGEPVTLVFDGSELRVDTGQDWAVKMNVEETAIETESAGNGTTRIAITYKGLDFEYWSHAGSEQQLEAFLSAFRTRGVDVEPDRPSLANYVQTQIQDPRADTTQARTAGKIGPGVARTVSSDVTRWEYTSLQRSTNSLAAMMNDLNLHGQSGWELVSLTFLDRTLGLNSIVAIIKRPLA